MQRSSFRRGSDQFSRDVAEHALTVPLIDHCLGKNVCTNYNFCQREKRKVLHRDDTKTLLKALGSKGQLISRQKLLSQNYRLVRSEFRELFVAHLELIDDTRCTSVHHRALISLQTVLRIALCIFYHPHTQRKI